MSSNKSPNFDSSGYTQFELNLPSTFRAAIESEDWGRLDTLLSTLTRPGNLIFEKLSLFTEVNEIEL